MKQAGKEEEKSGVRDKGVDGWKNEIREGQEEGRKKE
jgi:hypothetical protein